MKDTLIFLSIVLSGLIIIFSVVGYVEWKNYEEEAWFSGKVITNEFVEDEIDYMKVSFDGNRTYKIIPDGAHPFRIGDNYSRVILYREPNGEHPDLWHTMATFYAPIWINVDLTKSTWDDILNQDTGGKV